MDFLPEQVVQQQLRVVAAGAGAGVLRPLPVVAHGLGSVAAALRQMSQARHVGKIIINAPAERQQLLPHQQPGLVAIPGGLGYLGSLVAAWLAQQGVQHLLLLGV